MILMVIKLEREVYGNDIFWDKLISVISNNVENRGYLDIDISKADWLNEYQLTSFPFVLSYLRKQHELNLSVTYYCDDLFNVDKAFDYYCASGFFSFLNSLGITTTLSKQIPQANSFKDKLINFQSFNNISDYNSNIDGRRLMYELSSQMDLLSDIFRDDIFGKTDVGDKLAKVVIKELIENISQHSKSSAAIVRFRYIRNINEISHNYSSQPEIMDYFKYHRKYGFFILTVSDNGVGIIESIKSKYSSGEFNPYKNEDLKEMLKDKSSAWWLQRAFESHNVSADKKRRSRIGLHDIVETVKEYQGLLYVRSQDAGFRCISKDPSRALIDKSLYYPNIEGTHYVVYLPAIERIRKHIDSINIMVKGSYISTRSLPTVNLMSVDINYNKSLSHITTKIESIDKYIESIVSHISEEISAMSTSSDKLLQIDFSNGINVRVRDYIHILSRLYKKHKILFTSRVILRNVSLYVIEALLSSDLAKDVNRDNSLIIAFNNHDELVLIGNKSKYILDDMYLINKLKFVDIDQLSSDTINVIQKNGYILSTTYISDNSKLMSHDADKTTNNIKMAYMLPFSDIFQNEFDALVEYELSKSKALVDGHFVINDKYHVDKYLIVHLMYNNPALCRYYAKLISIKIGKKAPDILVSYSITGMIMYYYLKTYHYNDLGIDLVKGPDDLTHIYGKHVSANDSVLILTDVNMTGSFMAKLRNYVQDKTDFNANIIAQISVFDVGYNDISTSEDIKPLYSRKLVKFYYSNKCICNNIADKSYSVAAPEIKSSLPTVYQQMTSEIQTYLERRDRLNNINQYPNKETRKTYPSLIDDQNSTAFQLLEYWENIQHAFQSGHVERNHTHFDHYDIPERLLFNNITNKLIEMYIKQFSWSFENHIDYVIYPRELTTAYLAHLVANKFLRKPIVVDARRLPSGQWSITESVVSKLKDKYVILVDDACNTGITLKELIGLISLYEGHVAGVFTITNRNSPENEYILRTMVPKVATAFRFNIGVFQKGICHVCKQYDYIKSLRANTGTPLINKYIDKRLSQIEVVDYDKS